MAEKKTTKKATKPLSADRRKRFVSDSFTIVHKDGTKEVIKGK